jgi:hypothetical protein
MEGTELQAPDTASLGSRDRVEAKSSDGDDAEEDEKHERDGGWKRRGED